MRHITPRMPRRVVMQFGGSEPERAARPDHHPAQGRSFATQKRLAQDNRVGSVLVAAAQIIDKHLLDWLVVSHEHVANSVSADEVTNFFGEIFGVVAGALQ